MAKLVSVRGARGTSDWNSSVCDEYWGHADQEKLSDAMIGYWTRFAATGDPNSRHALRLARCDCVAYPPDIASLD